MNKLILTGLLILFSLTTFSQSQTDFCFSFTQNAQFNSLSFKKSYFTHDNNCFIQVMYVNELASDSRISYELMSRESKDYNYRKELGKKTFDSYKKHGVIDKLIDNGFENFKMTLIYEDDSKLHTPTYSIKLTEKEKRSIRINAITNYMKRHRTQVGLHVGTPVKNAGSITQSDLDYCKKNVKY